MSASSRHPLTGNKLVLVGCSGSGKSTLGESLSKALGLPLLCLDAISHKPYFQDTPPETFRSQVIRFTELNPNGWIIDGNYINVLGLSTWEAATDIIWLDYPIYVVLWRLWFRTIARIRSGVKLWGLEGCVETWQSQFFSRDSLFLWVFFFYRKRRPVFYEELVAKKKGQLEGVSVIRFQWPSETASWLDRIQREQKGHEE